MANAAVSLSPMNANQLLSAARAESAATTQGPLEQLASQIAAQNAQTHNATNAVAGYFHGLGNYVNQQTGRVEQAGAQQNSQLAGIASGLQNQLGNIQANESGLVSAYTPKGDADVSAAGQQGLAQQLATQQGNAATSMAAVQGQGANAAAGFNDLAHTLAGAYGTEGQQDLANINLAGAGKVMPLEQKVADEVGKGQALTESDLVKLRQQEITNNYHNSQIGIDEGALGIKQQTANTTAANDQGKLGVAQENAATASQRAASTRAYQQGVLGVDQSKAATAATEAQYSDALKQAEANLKSGRTPTPLSASTNNTMLEELGSAVARAKLMQKAGDKPAQIQEALKLGGKSTSALSLNGKPLLGSNNQPRYSVSTVKGLGNPALVQAVLEVASTGAITHSTWVNLHNLGIHNLPFKVAAP